MQRQKVSSEAIRSIGYNPEKEILEIKFNSGGLYQYFSVPEAEAENILNAESKGTYFQNKIRGHFRYIRLN